MGTKVNAFFTRRHFDFHRQQHTLRPTVNTLNHICSRSGVINAFTLFVGEQQLAFVDLIAFFHFHGGFHAGVVGAENGHCADSGAVSNGLLWRPTNGKFKSPPDLNHSFAQFNGSELRPDCSKRHYKGAPAPVSVVVSGDHSFGYDGYSTPDTCCRMRTT